MRPEKLYDNIHDLYDRRHMLAPSTQWLKKHEDPIIRNLKGRTLDIGCGTGHDLRLLDDAVGIDPSRQMLEIAKKTGKKVVLGRAEKLPFPDEAFDNAICLFGTLNMCDYRKAVSEMARVLKPGGTAVVSVASVWDRGYGMMKRFSIKHPARDKTITIDGNKTKLMLFERGELTQIFRSNELEIKKFIPLFKFQNPRWGDWTRLTLWEKVKLRMDMLPVFGSYGAMYIMVFKKNKTK